MEGAMQLGCENDFQVTARQEMGPQSYNHKKPNSTNNLSDVRRGFSAAEDTAALANLFILALHDPT